jgi:hypothetical protein
MCVGPATRIAKANKAYPIRGDHKELHVLATFKSPSPDDC